MKVCPVQKFGMKPVMEHFVATGQVLGKGTHALEGYELHDQGYFGPGELPTFDREFFKMPHGKAEDWVFEQFVDKVREIGGLEKAEAVPVVSEFKEKLALALNLHADVMDGMDDENADYI